jgi:hypothetical protein
MESPKVASSGVSSPVRRLRVRIPRCNAKPATPAAGRMTIRARNGLIERAATSEEVAKAATTARSPWARLMIRITPNISDRPEANSA